MTPEEERQTMQMLEALQRANDPRAVALQQNFQRGMEQVTGRDRLRIDPDVVRAKEPAPGRLYGGQVQAPKDTRNPFVQGLSRFTRRAMDALADPVANAQIVAALNSMRMRPDAQLVQAAQARAQAVQARRQSAQQANMTAQYLRTRGRDDLAKLIEANPSMATEVLSSALGIGDTFATKGFAPQVDPQTGQLFGVQYDPNTGQYSRVDVAGAVGETPAQVLARETETELEVMDRERAMRAGQDAFVAAERATGTIDTLTRALSALNRGGESGFVAQYLPSFNEATTTLRQAATEMGIDLIQSATFGALSESELRLALSSTIDLNLPEPELRKLLEEKIRVQRILRDELMKKARELSAGKIKFSDHIQNYKVQGGTEAIQYTPSVAPIVVREEDL